MSEYRVTWVIDLEAESPLAAAEEALRIHRDPTSIATVFAVKRLGTEHTVTIDLHEIAESAT